MNKERVIIMGAAGRDFHNFNMMFRENEAYEVVAFTATQIPNIDDRLYPPEYFYRKEPRSADWTQEECEAIRALQQGGWKFKCAWTHALQYGLLHRSESATSQKWYTLRRNSGEAEEEGVDAEEKVKRGKLLCRQLMKILLKEGPPRPRPFPKTFKETSVRMGARCSFAKQPRYL